MAARGVDPAVLLADYERLSDVDPVYVNLKDHPGRVFRTATNQLADSQRSRPEGSLSVLVMTDLGTLGKLTKKQFQVAKLYASGLGTKAIARELYNQTPTIEKH